MRVLSIGLGALLGAALASTAAAQATTQKIDPSQAHRFPGATAPKGTSSPRTGLGSSQFGGGGMIFISTDNCSSPTAISGTGTHPFDTTSATTSGFDGGGGCASGSTTINQDLFWQWTATVAGDYQFDTFGSTFDTKLSVHAGVGCAALCVAYNDDTSGLQSRVQVNSVNIGDTFVVQVGGFGSASGTGVLNISVFVPPANDTCAAADPLSGIGTTPFNTLAATTSGFDGGGTCAAGASTVNQDVFWQWTATAAGDYQFDTFTSGFDTKLSVHAGVGCAAVCVDYNDDTSGLQSRVQIPGINAGDTFLVQVGGFGSSSGVGVLNIGTYVPPPPPPDCGTLVNDAFEPNNSCAQAVPIGDGVYTNLNVSRTDPDFYVVQVTDGDTLTVDLLNIVADGDVDLFLYLAADCQDGDTACTSTLSCGYTSTDNEFVSWTNNTGMAQTCIIKVNIWPPSTQNDCNNYDLIISGAGGGIATAFCPGDGTAGTCPCSNPGHLGHGCANDPPGSPGGLLTASGSASVGAADLVLHGSDLEPGQFGLFFQGTTQLNGGLGFPLGDGLLCIGGQVIRLQAVPVNGLGQTATTLNLVTTGNISVGNVRGYQLWYRNTATTPCGLANNLTNALEITWQP